MIVPDVNLLIHAHNAQSEVFRAARRWWEDTLNSGEPVGLATQVLLSFVRLTTGNIVLAEPLKLSAAERCVTGWLAVPAVTILQPAGGHMELVFDLLRPTGAAGNLTSDAHLAALAIEHGAIVASTDTDFARFEKVRWFNPLTRPPSDRGR